MSSAMMVERTGTAMAGMVAPGVGAPGVGQTTGFPAGTNWLMVPRCTFKIEKCTGGIKVTCSSTDKMACSMVQNLCSMLTGGMCSCSTMMNGMMVCNCNFTMGMCKCDTTKDGVSLTCTSGDTKCCEMIQACGDCLACMLKDGCTCCLLLNNTPVCCGGY